MHILELKAENYKRLRVVEITPKGKMVSITGRNGQGKTSVLDSIYAALIGGRAIPEKPVRKGAERARIKLNLGEFIVTRTIAPNGAHTLTVENAKGVKVGTPQKILDELLGELTFDPLAFVQMKQRDQVELLRKVAKLDIDIDDLNAKNEADYAKRTELNREIKRLTAELSQFVLQEGLPAERVDEAAIVKEMEEAAEKNRELQQAMKSRQELAEGMRNAIRKAEDAQLETAKTRARIMEIESQLQAEKQKLAKAEAAENAMAQAVKLAREQYESAPEVNLIDVSELAKKLTEATTINREITKRDRHAMISKQLTDTQHLADELTRAMEERLEKKNAAIAGAVLPVEGLTFTEAQVIYNGIPIEQLGEGEQIRISTSIAMAANPQLRVIRIMHGEALDSQNLAMLAKMAEENDYQIWVAKVDDSGKCGLVMEDGMVKSEE